MANNFKVRVQVELVECNDPVMAAPMAQAPGRFELVLEESTAASIDACAQAILTVGYAALRDAFAHHCQAMAQRYALAVAGSLHACAVKPYRVEGEIGRLEFDAYFVPDPGAGDGTPGGLFPRLRAKEWYRTYGFQELTLVYGVVDASYRRTAAWLNHVRHQPEATPSRTLQEQVEAEGKALQEAMERQAATILQTHGFTDAGAPVETSPVYAQPEWVSLSVEAVAGALAACAPASAWVAEMEQNRTIAHIAHAGAAYTISGAGIATVLRLVLAFLLHNQLLPHNLVFFVDGQRTLYGTILTTLAWFKPLQVILDWYHLEKRCQELLSAALCGRHVRNAVLEQLLPCLWHGCVDRAMAVLLAIDPAQIKNQEALITQMEYLERNRPHLPCDAVRRHLGLRNSSNVGEKANDREYARQKLAELEAGLRQFESKYGMTFEAYHHIWETEDRPEHYTFEAENDYLMWEGLVTRHKRLSGSFAWLP